jgi:hypothetical protein
LQEKEDQNVDEMRQAAFRAFASLGANDEEIRKKVSFHDFVFIRARNIRPLNSTPFEVELAIEDMVAPKRAWCTAIIKHPDTR